jgi:CHAT domain-containing protein/Tfp pilus assembly protein PilF
LLGPDLPHSLDASDAAIWRKLAQGMAKAFSQQFGASERLLTEAEALAKAKHPELLGEVTLREGTLAFLRADPNAANSAYHRALQISREQRDPFLEAAALGSLGLIATTEEHYDESLDWNRAALQLSQSTGAQISAARILGNMGWSYFELGDYEMALSLFERAAAAFGQAGLIGAQVDWLTNIGVTDYYVHDFLKAENQTQKALGLARDLDEKVSIVECLNNLSNLALDRGQIDLAEQYEHDAEVVSRSANDSSRVVTSLLIAGKIAAARKQYPRAEALLGTVIRGQATGTATRWEAEARLAKVFDDEGNPAKAEREYRRSVETIEAARQSVGQDELRLTFLSSAVEFYDDYVDFLIAHGRADAALQVAELSRAATLAAGLLQTHGRNSVLPTPLTAMHLARHLHSTLLFYWLGENHSYLWAITRTKIEIFQLPPSGDIELLVKSYRMAQAEGRDVFTSSDADGQKLYQLLVTPAQKLIPANSRVIILPDAGLYSLNFETLIVPSPQRHFWIEDATISTANSLTLLGAAASRSVHDEKNLLLLGDTVQASSEFPALRQAPQEISLLEKYFPESQRTELVKEKATPTAYLSSNPDRYAYLHFVTHGTASRTRPLESSVVLSPEGDSYKLYARDIVKHKLNAQLVTISACNGSGTRAYSGEGLVGLSWAFLRAGAHNVIGALWEVSDASTPQLMDTLYGGLSRGQDPATALRNAKLSLLHSDSPYKKPYYWAPFQLYTGS